MTPGLTGRSSGHLEQEVKLSVWPGFSLPDLSDVVEGATVERVADHRLDATYHDTRDLRLARRGITLRHRTGAALSASEGAGEDGWTLKLPKSTAKALLVRDEILVEGDPKTIPDVIREHVLAWVRTEPLLPIARLQTLRARAVVRDADGKQLAEVVDDEVSVLDGRHVALRFREVEVEITDAAEDKVLDEIVARLRAAGAGTPDPTPKVVRALGPRALAAPELVVPGVDDDASAADALQAGITKAVLRILEHDAGVRLTDEPEAVHQARVGTRRLRSDLRTYASVLDSAWTESLRDELKWFADHLGAVRDADVLIERLEHDIAALDPADAVHAPILLEKVGGQRDAARAALLDAMASPRYVSLLDRLVDAALDPRVLPAAAKPARDVLPDLAAAPWKALAKAVKHAGQQPADDVLHAIRIRAKRARYAADVAALVIGNPAARFAEAVAGVQEVLGDHQDACVRRVWLREASTDLTPEAALVVGQLIAAATATAEDKRAAFPGAWKQASKGRLRAWLSR